MNTDPASEERNENDRWTIANCREDLLGLVDPSEGKKREGGIYVAETYFREMKHIGLLAFVGARVICS